MIYYKLTSIYTDKDGGIHLGDSYIDTFKGVLEALPGYAEDLETSDSSGFLITVIEMTEEEFNDLPEFEGF